MKKIKFALSISILIALSCKKQQVAVPHEPPIPRTIRFLLSTDKDFSNDQHDITFSVFIQNSTNKILWDSTLAPMKVKDIPAPENKLVIEKRVPGNDGSLLKVGFRYSIADVGYAGYIDSSNAGETFKIVDFNFQ